MTKRLLGRYAEAFIKPGDDSDPDRLLNRGLALLKARIAAKDSFSNLMAGQAIDIKASVAKMKKVTPVVPLDMYGPPPVNDEERTNRPDVDVWPRDPDRRKH